MNTGLQPEIPLPHGPRAGQLDRLPDTLDQHLQVLRVDEVIRIDQRWAGWVTRTEPQVAPAAHGDSGGPDDDLPSVRAEADRPVQALELQAGPRAIR